MKAFTVMQALLPISLFVLRPILEEGRPHSALSTVKNGAVWGRCGLQDRVPFEEEKGLQDAG